MTLGEALDRGLAFVDWSMVPARRGDHDSYVYFAYEVCKGDVLTWKIGQKLYDSRKGKSFRPRSTPMPASDDGYKVDMKALHRLIEADDWDATIAFLADAQVAARYGDATATATYRNIPSIRTAYDLVSDAFDVDIGTIAENVHEFWGRGV